MITWYHMIVSRWDNYRGLKIFKQADLVELDPPLKLEDDVYPYLPTDDDDDEDGDGEEESV